MGSSCPSIFTAAVVPRAPEDPLFGLMRAYRQDPYPQKVDLGIGAYRDDNAKPWVLPVVRKVRSPSPDSSVCGAGTTASRSSLNR